MQRAERVPFTDNTSLMPLQNYTELQSGGGDLDAGFQWEFTCCECNRRWKTPYMPYRVGQISGLFNRLGGLFGGRWRMGVGDFSSVGLRGARETALAKAQDLAAERFTECPGCRKGVCLDCMNAEQQVCAGCLRRRRDEQRLDSSGPDGVGSRQQTASMICPGCQKPHPGGRFCPECGFDLASTHKTCPGCGAMAARQARFCLDCGHAF